MKMYEYPKFPLSYQNFPYLYVLFSRYFPAFQNLLLNGNKEETRKRDKMRESAIKRVSCKTKSLGGEGSPTKLQPPYSKTQRPPCFHDKNNTHWTPNTTTCRRVFSGMPHQNPAKSKRMVECNKIRGDFQWLWQDTFCISITTKIRPLALLQPNRPACIPTPDPWLAHLNHRITA